MLLRRFIYQNQIRTANQISRRDLNWSKEMAEISWFSARGYLIYIFWRLATRWIMRVPCSMIQGAFFMVWRRKILDLQWKTKEMDSKRKYFIWNLTSESDYTKYCPNIYKAVPTWYNKITKRRGGFYEKEECH